MRKSTISLQLSASIDFASGLPCIGTEVNKTTRSRQCKGRKGRLKGFQQSWGTRGATANWPHKQLASVLFRIAISTVNAKTAQVWPGDNQIWKCLCHCQPGVRGRSNLCVSGKHRSGHGLGLGHGWPVCGFDQGRAKGRPAPAPAQTKGCPGTGAMAKAWPRITQSPAQALTAYQQWLATAKPRPCQVMAMAALGWP